ncbi:MAG: HYR domain-containing protein, partial [Blastocatellia bacterium]
GPIVFSKATVAAGETAVFTIVVKVNSNTANGATITNSATAATTTTDPTPGNNTGTATTTVQTQADLAVTKSDSPDPVFAGSNLTYTINFSNAGPSDAQTVTITDAVPANTTFVSAVVTTGSGWTIPSPPAVGGTGTVTFTKATVAAGETAVFTMVVKVDAATPNNSTITNTATAATVTTDSNSGNNSATATTTVIAQADLAVTKSDSPDPVCVNGNLTYTINFVDNGPGPGLSTTVTDAVPVNTTFVSASVMTGTGWSTSQPAVGGTGNVVFSKANVANGETATFIMVVKVNAGTMHGTTISNSVTAASSIPDPTPGNNTAMATTTVDPIAPTITCPAPIIIPALSGQCAAPATFAPTTSDNCAVASVVCSPASGSSFPVGTTTVMCTATDTAGNTASCSFTVKVNDTQPPTFPNGCPAMISTVTPITCPLTTSQTVTYATPAIMDNCPGATVTCVPPSGSVFTTGTTSVTCTATDTAGNTATCSFAVRIWTGCLQDETNPGNVVLFDALTGDYQFCCNGVVTATGTGTLTVRGCTVQFDHIKGNRKIKITADMAVKRGTATLIIANQITCIITDQNMANNSCACPVVTKVAKP